MRHPTLRFVLGAVVAMLIAQSTFSSESIDLAAINALLIADQKLFAAKNADGLMELLSDDFVYVFPGKPPVDKSNFRLQVYNSFITAKHVMLKRNMISYEIASDGLSADVEIEETTKYLVERGGSDHVISIHTISRIQLVYSNEKVLFRRAEVIKILP